MNICDYQKLGGQRYKKFLWGGGSKLVLGSPWCRAAVGVAGPKKQVQGGSVKEGFEYFATVEMEKGRFSWRLVV